MNRELISVIDELGRQKGIDKSRVIGAIEAALQMADRKSTRLNSSHERLSRMPSSA